MAKIVGRPVSGDAAVLGGSTPGLYEWGGIDVQVFPDGHLLNRGVAQLMAATEISLEDAVMLCTANPSRILGEPIQAIEEGGRADLVLFDHDSGDDALRIKQTYAAGQLIYTKRETEAHAQPC